ncbi:MAG: hypothetical protein ACJASS_001691 [Sulfitobacter sp.]|jgi:hypothetical protein
MPAIYYSARKAFKPIVENNYICLGASRIRNDGVKDLEIRFGFKSFTWNTKKHGAAIKNHKVRKNPTRSVTFEFLDNTYASVTYSILHL